MQTLSAHDAEQIAGWLKRIDSHGIYPADLIDELPETVRDAIPTYNGRAAKQRIIDRGLGGEYHGTDDDMLFSGYSASRALAVRIAGEAPGDMYHGRGTSHRHNVQRVTEWLDHELTGEPTKEGNEHE